MPRKRRRRSRQNDRRIIWGALALVVGTALILGFQTDRWKQWTTSISRWFESPETLVRKVEGQPEESEFDIFLAQSDAQQLILRSTELADSSGDPLVERLDRQHKRIQIAEMLIANDEDARSRTFGIISRLTALRTRAWINFAHGLYRNAEIEELKQQALNQITSEDEDTRREAQLLRLAAVLIQNLESKANGGPQEFELTLKDFESVGNQYDSNPEVAAELFACLEQIHVHATPEVFDQFVATFREIYSKSERGPLRELAQNAKTQIALYEFEFVDIVGTTGKREQELVDRLRKQLDEALDRAAISQQGYVEIFDAIRTIARSGNYASALESADKLQRRLAVKDALQPLAATLRKFRQQYGFAGKPFPSTGILKLDGSPFQVRHENAPMKVVVFSDAQGMEDTRKAVSFMMKIAGQFIDEGKFCLAVIYLDDGENGIVLKNLIRLAALAPTVDFSRIDLQTDSGRGMLERLSSSTFPLVMLLDQDNVVRGVDISAMDFEKQISERFRDAD